MTTKQLIVSWHDFHDDAKALAEQLHKLEQQWQGIMAVTRGGLVPAAILARELEIRLIETVCIASYDHDEQSELSVLKAPSGDGEGWVIVDDLVDTGETVKQLRRLYPKAHIATVYAKPKGKALVDTFIEHVDQDTWIQLPWDMALSYQPPLSKQP